MHFMLMQGVINLTDNDWRDKLKHCIDISDDLEVGEGLIITRTDKGFSFLIEEREIFIKPGFKVEDECAECRKKALKFYADSELNRDLEVGDKLCFIREQMGHSIEFERCDGDESTGHS